MLEIMEHLSLSLRMPIDKNWFLNLIENSPYTSQRQLARKIKAKNGKPLAHSALSDLLNGKRGIRPEEAQQMADLLGVPLPEVLKRFGVTTPVEDSPEVRVTGLVNKNWELEKNGRGVDTVPSPGGLPLDGYALKYAEDNDPYEGWLFFMAGDTKFHRQLSPKIHGKFCLIGIKKKPSVLGFIYRSGKRGMVAIVPGFVGNLFEVPAADITSLSIVCFIQPK